MYIFYSDLGISRMRAKDKTETVNRQSAKSKATYEVGEPRKAADYV